ncbi:hypothetical protein LN042_35085 [Kitasatospora sp. RB6PN24]|uniref:hypothetical protein n=1 Tax=Kitasatospora humi TaxID=2893891 RepID=UPI001E2A7FFE|nr:hypothetical protein [Kitasatospora humi]MCC9312228.1 hypothetical protein [Kitasatospora humi]
MTLGFADQASAVRIAGTAISALQLDAVWTAGVDDLGNRERVDIDAAHDLEIMAIQLADRLRSIHDAVPFLYGFAEELAGLLSASELPDWPVADIQADELPALLRDATEFVEQNAQQEARQLIATSMNLWAAADEGADEGSEAGHIEGDLPLRMRVSLSIIGGVLLCGLSVIAGPGGPALLGVGCVLLADGFRLLRVSG